MLVAIIAKTIMPIALGNIIQSFSDRTDEGYY